MTDASKTRQRLIELAEPVCASAGYELADIEYRREGNGWVVRVFIEHAPASVAPAAASETIGFADCEAVSRELSAVFDVEDPVSQAYSLEVSSPGVDRPLRNADHFARFAGQNAKVVLGKGLEGRKNFKGTLLGFDEENQQVLIDVDGSEFRLPLSDLRSAKLVPDWDTLMAAAKQADKDNKKNQRKAAQHSPS